LVLKYSLYAPCPIFHGLALLLWTQVKSSRRDVTTVVTFKDELGSMGPVVSCKEHNSRRDVYEICEMNEAGEVIKARFRY